MNYKNSPKQIQLFTRKSKLVYTDRFVLSKNFSLTKYPDNRNRKYKEQNPFQMPSIKAYERGSSQRCKKGGKGGHLPSGVALWGGPNWGRNVTNKLRNVKCERMLIPATYKLSNVIAKTHQDHHGSQNEQLW